MADNNIQFLQNITFGSPRSCDGLTVIPLTSGSSPRLGYKTLPDLTEEEGLRVTELEDGAAFRNCL